ncbi:hypothetical protein M2163_000923 [Streptomyces sp. SAI-135]|jgi:hypothetical protein|uniref:hypothetical protein n=1 Tax=unclassified Streptomyces TaxID=2593676 RepID=UPI002474F5EC|nr:MULTISPECIES: hypothetical protein [unclassified Streptomyces]MDH6522566.1 hypothetical protein [Streptomyces sp. SAI-090]MDH6554189.1 hypothetical protein [Streptomyces sp. SAI-041]MDH6573451.1 hypothetical protein [Streptomyces sp. SAI-117]MDH6581812.1 hypothetical protein [Streptomyces sp. SAI-133]MDH6613815.1 hypothetical protein [Streptomyces sp. SAI-135]
MADDPPPDPSTPPPGNPLADGLHLTYTTRRLGETVALPSAMLLGCGVLVVAFALIVLGIVFLVTGLGGADGDRIGLILAAIGTLSGLAQVVLAALPLRRPSRDNS